MSRRSLAWPLALIVAFAVLVVLLIVGALPTPTGAQTDQCAITYPTPGEARNNCYRTATAVAGPSYPSPTATSSGGGDPAPQPTATLTVTATLSATSTLTPDTPTAGPTSTATSTRAPQSQDSPTPSATSTLTNLETIACVPGSTVPITGTADPGSALLAYFNERPVGGALTRPDGSYSIQLHIGDERPGIYPVDVRERDGKVLVRELACEVPALTPTPTALLAP